MQIAVQTLVNDIRQLSGLRGNQLFDDDAIASMASDVWQELYDKFVAVNQHYNVSQFTFSLSAGNAGPALGVNMVELPEDFQLGNGLELNPGTPHPWSVPYLENWLNRNSLGLSVLINSMPVMADRRYCFSDRNLIVWPVTNAAGSYRLWYTPMCPQLALEQTVTWTIDDDCLPSDNSGLLSFAFDAGTHPEFNEGMIGGSITCTFDAANDDYNVTDAEITGPDPISDNNTIETNIPWPGGLVTHPITGTVSVTYQPQNTVSILPVQAAPWALYIKLGTAIAIRQARQQDAVGLERRLASQKDRVESILINRQEEPTQPPLTRGASVWDWY